MQNIIKQHGWKPLAGIIFIWLMYQLWFDDTGILANISMQNQIENQIEVNAEIEARNQVLAEEVLAVKSGLSNIEAKARKELGMIKKDETYFLIAPRKISD